MNKQEEGLQRLKDEGKKCFNGGDNGKSAPQYEQAFLCYSEAIALSHTDADLFCQRGRTLMALGKFPEAIYDFTWALKLETDLSKSPAAISKYNRFAGNCYFEMSQFQEALMHYNQALQKEESGINHFNKGLVLSKLDQLKMANKSLITAKEKFIAEKANELNGYYCRYNLGINLRKLGEYEASIIELKEAAEISRNKASVYNNLGLTYFENNEMDQAVAEFSKAIQREPQSVHYNNRGLAYFHEQKIDDALADFDKAVELNTIGDPTVYFNRGNAYLSQNMFEKAIDDYDRASKISQQTPKYHHAKGIAYEALASQVEKQFGKHQRFNMTQLPVENRCSSDMQSYLREDYLKFCRDAINMYLAAVNVDENFNQARFHLGRMYSQIYSYPDAIKNYSRVIQQQHKTDNSELQQVKLFVYLERGITYLAMDKEARLIELRAQPDLSLTSDSDFVKKAIKDFACAIDIQNELGIKEDKQQWVKPYLWLAKARLKNNQISEAIKDFTDALAQLDTVIPVILDGLGQCYQAMHNYEEALDNYRQAIEREPSNVEFLTNRAQCYYRLGMFDECRQDQEMALTQNPYDSTVLYQLGLTHYAAANYKKCIKTMKLALKNKPYISFETDIYYHIGLAYCKVQKFEKSIWPFSRCIERIPQDIRYVHERAKAHQMIEYHDNAVEDFSAVIKRNPKNAHAHFRRAFSLKALKRYAEAADDFQQAKDLSPLDPKMIINYKQLKGVHCIVLCDPGEEPVFN